MRNIEPDLEQIHGGEQKRRDLLAGADEPEFMCLLNRVLGIVARVREGDNLGLGGLRWHRRTRRLGQTLPELDARTPA